MFSSWHSPFCMKIACMKNALNVSFTNHENPVVKKSFRAYISGYKPEFLNHIAECYACKFRFAVESISLMRFS